MWENARERAVLHTQLLRKTLLTYQDHQIFLLIVSSVCFVPFCRFSSVWTVPRPISVSTLAFLSKSIWMLLLPRIRIFRQTTKLTMRSELSRQPSRKLPKARRGLLASPLRFISIRILFVFLTLTRYEKCIQCSV